MPKFSFIGNDLRVQRLLFVTVQISVPDLVNRRAFQLDVIAQTIRQADSRISQFFNKPYLLNLPSLCEPKGNENKTQKTLFERGVFAFEDPNRIFKFWDMHFEEGKDNLFL